MLFIDILCKLGQTNAKILSRSRSSRAPWIVRICSLIRASCCRRFCQSIWHVTNLPITTWYLYVIIYFCFLVLQYSCLPQRASHFVLLVAWNVCAPCGLCGSTIHYRAPLRPPGFTCQNLWSRKPQSMIKLCFSHEWRPRSGFQTHNGDRDLKPGHGRHSGITATMWRPWPASRSVYSSSCRRFKTGHHEAKPRSLVAFC